MTASIMVGNKVGEKRYDLAQNYSIRFLYISIISGVIMAIALFLSASGLTHLFALDQNISNLITKSLIFYSFLLPLKFLATVIIVGIIRGGGSTTYAFLVEAACVWGIGVPAVFISIFIFKLPLPYIYLVMGLEEGIKTLIGFLKIKSKTWIKDFT